MRNSENLIQSTDLSAARMQYILGEVFITYAYKRMKEGTICDDPEQPFTDDWLITYRALSEAIGEKDKSNVVEFKQEGDHVPFYYKGDKEAKDNEVSVGDTYFYKPKNEEGRPTIYVTGRGSLLNDTDKALDKFPDSIRIFADQLTSFDFSEYIDNVPPTLLIIADCPEGFDYKYWYDRLREIKLKRDNAKDVIFNPIVYFFTVYPLPLDESFVAIFDVTYWRDGLLNQIVDEY